MHLEGNLFPKYILYAFSLLERCIFGHLIRKMHFSNHLHLDPSIVASTTHATIIRIFCLQVLYGSVNELAFFAFRYGKEASSFWGGADNPDGSKKRVAEYDTKDKKKGRQKVCQQRARAESKQVRKLFVERRDELLKLGQWKGPNVFQQWLMQLATKVLQGEDEAAAAQMPEVHSLLTFVYLA